MLLTVAGGAARAEAVYDIDIPSMNAAEALNRFAEQTGAIMLFPYDLAGTRRANAVNGRYTLLEGLALLLQGTGLSGGLSDKRVVNISSDESGRQHEEEEAMKSGRVSFGSRVASVMGAILTASGAVGQDIALPPQERAEVMQEIIVTAQKRSERLSEIPQSGTAFSGEQLARQGVTTLQDLADRVPGLMTNTQGGAGRQQLTMRGITNGLDVSPTVGIYVDDVPYGSGTVNSGSSSLALELGAFDLQRIEVLRGPQGTLYGASAFGGVVKYVLEEPDLNAFGGRVQAEGSDTTGGAFSYGLRGALSIPVVPGKFAARATIAHNENAGFVRDVGSAQNRIDKGDTSVGRLSLLGQPTEKLTLRALLLAQDIERSGTSMVDYDGGTGLPIAGDFAQERRVAEPFEQEFRLYSAGMDYDLGVAAFSATASYQTIDSSFLVDSSAAYVPLLGPMLESMGTAIDASAFDIVYTTDKRTVEARLTSPSNGSFEWLTGIYYTRESSTNFQALIGFDGGVRSSLDIGTFLLPTTFEETAGYVNGTYYVTDRVDVSAGVRVSRDDQTHQQIGSGLLASSNPGSDSRETVTTYLVTARYHLPVEGMIYLRAASGYRPGGPNLIAFDPVTGEPFGDTSFEADTLWNYEAGLKLRPATWLSADLSIYLIDWDDIQLFSTSNGISVMANAGSAETKGMELSFTASPLDGWTIRGSAAHTDASLRDAAPDLGARRGERLPNVPRWSTLLSAEYSFQVSKGLAHVGFGWRYVGERHASFDASETRPQYRLPGYDSVDLTAGVNLGDWNLDLYARNVFDDRGQGSADTSMAQLGGPVWVSVIRPRTVGVVVSRSF